MREGCGSATAQVRPVEALRFLADPVNAGQWFAGAELVMPPEGKPRAGLTWRFGRIRGTRGPVSMRMTVFEPPERFVWSTERRWPADNLEWEVRCTPTAGPDGDGAVATGTGALASSTRIDVCIRQRPGPVGAVSLALVPRRAQAALETQAQRAADRAAEALESAQAERRGERPHPGQGRRGRGRRRR